MVLCAFILPFLR